ncbi:polysaccharide pyruvyl transferase family protein [Candidatus Pacearchaeota archaeon]|nr:polysaccharide pyruvyl transferase family protein [Candidatus Pacearchaeota archaeon]
MDCENELLINTENPLRIGIWGHYHGGNQGDECVVKTLIDNIVARRPEAKICAFSLNPADTQQRYGIEAFPLRWSVANRFVRRSSEAESRVDLRDNSNKLVSFVKATVKKLPLLHKLLKKLQRGMRLAAAIIHEPLFLWSSYRIIKKVDLLVVPGSHPLFDAWAGTWSHPYTVFKWALLARLGGTRFAFLSVGCGPVNTRLSRFFLRSALQTTYYRSYRDPGSAREARDLGVSGKHPVFPDMAFSLDVGCIEPPAVPENSLPRRKIVGLNPMGFFPLDMRYSRQSETGMYEAYVSKLDEFAEWLIKNGYTVMLLYSDLDFDPCVKEDLKNRLEQRPDLDIDGRLIEFTNNSFEDLIRQMSMCDCLVVSRFHCVLLPFILHKPVIGLAYHGKTHELMASLGQADYAMDVDDFEVDDLIERFQRLCKDSENIRSKIAQRIPVFRQALEAQYDQLFGPRVLKEANLREL